MEDDLCVFFEEEDLNESKSIETHETQKSLYQKDGREIIYDNHTMIYYTTLRKRKLDPITNETLTDENAFVFPY